MKRIAFLKKAGKGTLIILKIQARLNLLFLLQKSGLNTPKPVPQYAHRA